MSHRSAVRLWQVQLVYLQAIAWSSRGYLFRPEAEKTAERNLTLWGGDKPLNSLVNIFIRNKKIF